MTRLHVHARNLAAVVFLGALGLAGCGKEEPKPEAKGAAAPPTLDIRIGHVAPLTGGIAHLGKDNENGARLAIDEANAANITIDGKQARFSLVPEDDQADPKTGTTVAQKLVDAKVAGVVGHLNSGTSIPASALYSGATLFAFPSLYEGFGLPVLEAMGCGTPVVASNTSAIPQVAGDAALLVDPRDVNALAEGMGRLLSDETLRAELRARGLERAQQFSWERTARDTLSVYEVVAAKG